MTPQRMDFSPQRPWRMRGDRRRGALLATATAVVMFSFLGVTPAYAEEVVPAPVESTDAATPPATDPPATDPPATDPPATDPPATDPPATDPPTDPPATDPPATDPPTDPTDPPATDPPTDPPATDPPATDPPADPADPSTDPTSPPATPTAPGTQAPSGPVFFSGNGPVVRYSTTAAPNPQVGALLAARSAIDRAVADLRMAESALADARSMREVARSIAEHIQQTADDAQLDADAAGRVYIAAVQGDGTTVSSMDAVFGAGNDLLAGLGGVARVAQIAGDANELLEIAEGKTEAAQAAQERADAAWAEVDAVPVEDLEDEVASAQRAVSAARTALTGLQARVAASSVALVDSLPADAGQLSDQGWALPVSGRITDGYGPRPNKPLAGVNEFHRGTDLAASCRAPIFAATGGTVVEARPNGTYGNWILVDHGAGVSTGYAHLIDGGILVSRRRDRRGRAAHRRRRQHGRVHRMPPALRGATRRRGHQCHTVHGGSRHPARLIRRVCGHRSGIPDA